MDLTVKASDVWTAMAGRLMNGRGPLNTLKDRTGLPNTAAYVLLKLHRKCAAELGDIDKAREKICQGLANKNDDGTPKMLPNGGGYDIPDLTAFGVAFNELLAQPVTLTGVRALRPSELGSIECSAQELEDLGPFLSDDDEAIAATA